MAGVMQVFHKDYEGSKLGMWIFLFTEVLLFGGMFILYGIYAGNVYDKEFALAGQFLDWKLGLTNTVILLTSSLSAAMAVTAIQKGDKKMAMMLLTFTIVCALGFLVVKYFEWGAKISHGVYPGSDALVKLGNKIDMGHGKLLEVIPGTAIFFGLYYTMTGIHGLHVVIGMLVLLAVLYFVATGKQDETDYIWVENAALYWHLVDLIWIFLFPLFYLVF